MKKRTGTTKITIKDDLHPEDNAMVQALQSRSPAPVEERLKKVEEAGSGQFMDKYYVGYGHRSIGDCGSTTIFVEGVTMLCAKAIQDWPLYCGQEASTRYMDFTEAEFYNPAGTPEGEEIQERWRELYMTSRLLVVEHLKSLYPRQEDEEEAVWERAINARSFDICRAFLPAGATTNLSWHTNLRQASDHLDWLLLHPDLHVRETAIGIHEALSQRYSNSFSNEIRHLDYRHEIFEKAYFQDFYGYDPNLVHVDLSESLQRMDHTERRLLTNRPRGMEVPWFWAALGNITSSFTLDFGSYRDLQRHRAGIIRMPLLTTELGFHPWYLESLPDDLRHEVHGVLFNQEIAIRRLNLDSVTRQNYVAMGYRVPCVVTQPLPGFIYRLELRSSKSVHPTLRRVVHAEILSFREQLPDIALHVDMEPDTWSVRRGKQTIVEK